MTAKTWVVGGAAVLVGVTATVVAMSGATRATPAAREPPTKTMKVERRELSAMVSLSGTLIFRAGPDGSPYTVVDQAQGIYTELPELGQVISPGQALY